MAIGLVIQKNTNETSECPHDYILPFFLLEDNNDIYTDWIDRMVKNPKRTTCEFMSGKKKCYAEPKPPKIRQTSDGTSKLMITNIYTHFVIIFLRLQFLT